MPAPSEFKMDAAERAYWDRVRRRGPMWFVVSKGLAFLLLYPAIGHFAIGWEADPRLLFEGWFVGLVCGSLVWMRREVRYRFTLEDEGLPVPDLGDD